VKINLGSGYKRIDGFLNIDDDPLVAPDYLLNVEKDKLPFPDNSVEEIRAHHILEHIGDGFIPLMQELYRVSKHGCLLDIIVPHHQHENFYSDPTHKRPITVGGMYLFCQKSNKESIERGDSNSTLGLKYGINFIVENYSFEYDGFYHGLISSVEEKRKNGKLTQEDDFMYRRLMREATNVAVHTIIKMRAVKE
jgi:ubiquinone/menaquinone biosynthesis C-methylase UbiE